MDIQSFSVTKGQTFNIKVPPEYMGGTFVSNAPNIVTFNGNSALAMDYGSATVEFNFNNNGCNVSKTFIINVGCDESITLVQQEGHGEVYEYDGNGNITKKGSINFVYDTVNSDIRHTLFSKIFGG